MLVFCNSVYDIATTKKQPVSGCMETQLQSCISRSLKPDFVFRKKDEFL